MGGRDAHVRLRVRCADSHHVATVYETEMGLTYVASLGARGHGSRDFVDVAHHDSSHGRKFVDVVEPNPESNATDDDELPAGCACGPRTLSRSELTRALAAGRRRMLVP